MPRPGGTRPPGDTCRSAADLRRQLGCGSGSERDLPRCRLLSRAAASLGLAGVGCAPDGQAPALSHRGPGVGVHAGRRAARYCLKRTERSPTMPSRPIKVAITAASEYGTSWYSARNAFMLWRCWIVAITRATRPMMIISSAKGRVPKSCDGEADEPGWCRYWKNL